MTEIKYGYIGTFKGAPIYTFPSNWMTDLTHADTEFNYIKYIAKQKYNEDIIIFSNYDICSFKLAILIYKIGITTPVYKCFIELDSCAEIPSP